MEWIADPSAWLGLGTLIVLELVLGIDNLVFIAILADKLPPHQRDKARMIGLSLALFMRLGLLFAISWLVTLTEPLFAIFDKSFSGRDLILLGGGLFLLFKATVELHERLEGDEEHRTKRQVYASFGAVIVQIVVLDAVFSLDSVITAVGMVDHLAVMMIAVVIAMGAMMLASKPLTRFVSRHPTLIILCLGLLLMIGFSLVAEGMGFHIPKGYLYAAIGFAIVIETFNQVATANKRKAEGHRPLRDRTADAVLRMLGGRVEYELAGAGEASTNGSTDNRLDDSSGEAFQPAERIMIRGVLNLADRQVTAIMTPRTDVHWIDLDDPIDMVKRELVESPYSRVVVVRGGRSDEPLGIVQKKDLLPDLLAGHALELDRYVQQPPVLPQFANVLAALERFKREPMQLAFIVDEFGSFIGLATATDVMEAIAGEMPDEHEPVTAMMVRQDDGSWLVDGRTDVDELSERLGLNLDDDVDYHTAAGLVLDVLGRIPDVGDRVDIAGWTFTVAAMDGNRIDRLQGSPAQNGDDDENSG